MEIRILKNVFLENLLNASKAVSSKSTQSILECVLLVASMEDGKHFLKIKGFDNEIGIETKKINCDILKEGLLALEAKIFIDIIRHLPEGEILISRAENGITTIKGGKSEFKILAKNPEEFPDLPVVDKISPFSIDAKQFKNMIKKTIFSASLDEQRPVLTGELIEIKDNCLNMVTVDTVRVSYARHTLEGEDTSEDLKVVVPARALNELSKLIDSEGEERINLYLSENFIMFENKDFILVSKVLHGEFIKYETYFLSDFETLVKLKRSTFIESLERASLIINRETLKKNAVKIEVSDNLLVVSCNTEAGTVHDELVADVDGKDLVISFNPKYLLDALKALEDDFVSLYFQTSLTPLIIKSENSDEFKYLILPLRINY